MDLVATLEVLKPAYDTGNIQDDMALASIDRLLLRDVQRALALLGYPVGAIDGLWGPRTRAAFDEYLDSTPEASSVSRDTLSPSRCTFLLTQLATASLPEAPATETPAQTQSRIVDACFRFSLSHFAQIAYVLATTQHETANTFQPVKEAYWLSEEWRENNLQYYPYYGRGYVQITWRRNYQLYKDMLAVDFVAQPDLALDPTLACFILVHGFKTGAFTGRSLWDFTYADGSVNFLRARRCINGTDRASDIAAVAEYYVGKLRSGDIA